MVMDLILQNELHRADLIRDAQHEIRQSRLVREARAHAAATRRALIQQTQRKAIREPQRGRTPKEVEVVSTRTRRVVTADRQLASAKEG